MVNMALDRKAIKINIYLIYSQKTFVKELLMGTNKYIYIFYGKNINNFG